MGYLQDGATIPAGKSLTNNGSYAGTPIVTSITAGSGISVTNPISPGAATVTNSGVLSITAGSGILVNQSIGNIIISGRGTINNLSDYAATSLNFSLSNNYDIRALALLR